MKFWSVLALAGLLLLSVAPTYGQQTPHDFLASPLQSGVQVSLGAAGDMLPADQLPQRDPAGNDWISYCDDPNVLWNTGGQNQIWARVRFTAPAAFVLQTITCGISNAQAPNVPFNLYVYRENGNNLGNRVFDLTLNNGLPDAVEGWHTFDIPEERYVQVQENETFTIIYGPCPSLSPENGGRGYWPMSDGGGGNNNRSFLALGAQPPAALDQWTDVVTGLGGGDLCIRANGTIEHFVDLKVNQVFNATTNQVSSGYFHMLPGTRPRYRAMLINNGDALDSVDVYYEVFDSNNDQVFWAEQRVRDIDARDTVLIQCDSSWLAETTGRYSAKVTVLAANDVVTDNDTASLDQFVINPEVEPDTWITYGTNVSTVADRSNGAGLAVIYYPPFGDQLYKLTGYRVTVQLEGDIVAEATVPIAIRRYHKTFSGYTDWFTTTLVTQAVAGDQTLELNFEGDSRMTVGGDSIAVLMAWNTDSVKIMVDAAPPVAGSNTLMPLSSGVEWPGGELSISRSGDYMIDGRYTLSDDAPAGKLLRFIPDSLNFGDHLSMNEDHVINAMIISYGADPVNITRMARSNAMRPYVTLSDTAYGLGSRDTAFVTVTFRAAGEVTLTGSPIAVTSDWTGHNNFIWRVTASTVGGAGVNENVKPGVPEVYALSQNFPNPFNPTTTINFALPVPGDVNFAVFDMSGRQVENSIQKLNAGYHSIDFDATKLPAGVYTYKLTSGDYSSTKKMVLLK